MSMCSPRPIGPRLRKRPSEISFTLPVTTRGSPFLPMLGMSSLPPSASVTWAPTPARIISLHRLRVVNRECGNVLQPGIEDAAEHRHRIHGAAGGRVVVVIEQYHRALPELLCAL